MLVQDRDTLLVSLRCPKHRKGVLAVVLPVVTRVDTEIIKA